MSIQKVPPFVPKVISRVKALPTGVKIAALLGAGLVACVGVNLSEKNVDTFETTTSAACKKAPQVVIDGEYKTVTEYHDNGNVKSVTKYKNAFRGWAMDEVYGNSYRKYEYGKMSRDEYDETGNLVSHEEFDDYLDKVDDPTVD